MSPPPEFAPAAPTPAPTPARAEPAEPVLKLPEVERALAEAAHLTRFAERNGVPMDQKHFERVFKAIELHREGKLTGDQLIEFHKAYHELACALAPVTVKGILDCVDEFGPLKPRMFGLAKPAPTARANSVVRLYRSLTLIALLGLVITHSFWLVGNRLVTDLREQSRATATAVVDATVAPKTGTDTEVDLTALGQQTAAHQNRRDQYDGYIDLLRGWVARVPFAWLFSSESTGNPASLPTTTATAIASTPAPGGAAAPNIRVPSPKTNSVIIKQASDYLEILQTLILPLLYGTIGALTYVLRQMSQDIQRRVFRMDFQVQYQLRVVLGALAGLGVGWFFQQAVGDTSGGAATGGKLLTGLTPTALAFLAGYSVELFFSLMDTIVSAFASNSQPGRRQGNSA